ncbi:glycosyltransferase family 2 protein [Aquabacterium lacunae]|uniref:Glycosyltransferase family 2 protein n=2 Tax=Aquabacterium lacunae TaxID=2528630 RepID=A0A4Q9H487_9BURK|nr:glycosyltransferase family 2 protein [Aquabacterium lacunae]
MSVELTILMPCLNEARTLPTCVQAAQSFLARAGVRGEVLVADNGSTDGSQALAQSLGARVVPVPEKGYGAALRGGIEAAHGRFVIMGDSDASYDFSRLDPFLQALRGGAQLVMGNRFAGGIAPGAMPALHRYLGNPVLSWVGRTFFKVPVRDFHCGLRGFDRHAVKALGLSTSGMEFASEMVVKAALGGLRISEVPTTLQPDGRDRPPHLRSWRDGWRHLRFLLLFSPRWLFLYPGLALILLGSLGMALILPGRLPLVHVMLDIHTLLYCAAAVIMGSQLAMVGALARVAGTQTGLLPPSRFTRWALSSFRLELALLVALASLLGSAFMVLSSWWIWQGAGFAQLDPAVVMRRAIPAVTLALLGVEIMVGAFFLTFLQFGHAKPRAA